MSWKERFDEKFPRSVKQCFVDYGIDNCIKYERPDDCIHESKETCGYYKDYCLMYGTDDIKDFIEALIKEKDEEIERLKEELRGYIEEEAGASL
jgi:hypothetical protein